MAHLEYSNTTLVKVKWIKYKSWSWNTRIQIQHLLKLNLKVLKHVLKLLSDSNTTLVKVKLSLSQLYPSISLNSNTTLVKVKYSWNSNLKRRTTFKYNTC